MNVYVYFGGFDGDPLIHMSFAENASRGRWFRFNPDEPVSGVTSFFWMFTGALGWSLAGIKGCLIIYDGLILLSLAGRGGLLGPSCLPLGRKSDIRGSGRCPLSGISRNRCQWADRDGKYDVRLLCLCVYSGLCFFYREAKASCSSDGFSGWLGRDFGIDRPDQARRDRRRGGLCRRRDRLDAFPKKSRGHRGTIPIAMFHRGCFCPDRHPFRNFSFCGNA